VKTNDCKRSVQIVWILNLSSKSFVLTLFGRKEIEEMAPATVRYVVSWGFAGRVFFSAST
jgi:hypothetical protein